MKQGLLPVVAVFRYRDSEFLRDTMMRTSEFVLLHPPIDPPKFLYRPEKTPILKEGPLTLSAEMKEIEVKVFLYNRKLDSFCYNFKFHSQYNKKKYIEIFNAILGNPIQYGKHMGRPDVDDIKYDNNYLLTLWETDIWFGSR